MRASVDANHAFVRKEVEFEDGRAAVEGQGQLYKIEILDDLAAKATAAGEPAPPITFYEHGPFSDLCRGPHVQSTGKIGPFKLLSVAAAYWRGDEQRPMLQRIYGTVWRNQEELDQFLWRRAEAKKRDHRRLGVQLDLFSFHDVSPGSAFWHPKGQLIWRTLEGVMRELQGRRGYQEVSTPIVVSERLWRQSGHWDLYRENMFLVESEDQTFSLKPMNCPESTFIYRSKRRSYRDLRCATASSAGSTATSARARCPASPAFGSSSRTMRTPTSGRTSSWTRSRHCSARSTRPTAGSG